MMIVKKGIRNAVNFALFLGLIVFVTTSCSQIFSTVSNGEDLTISGSNSDSVINVILTAPNTSISYNDNIDLDGFSIEEFKNDGSTNFVEPLLNMFSYDKENIGVQNAWFIYGDYKEEFELTIEPKVLETLIISAKNYVVNWSLIEGDLSYEVYVNDTTYFLNTNSFSLADSCVAAGNISVKVKAIATSSKYTDSEYSNTLTFDKLNEVSDIQYVENTLTWEEITMAVKYDLLINGEFYTSSTNSLVFTDFQTGENTVIIQAVGNGEMIIDSHIFSKTFNKLYPVENIEYNYPNLQWDSENESCTYQVDYGDESIVTEDNYCELYLDSNIEYIITITALSNSSDTISSSSVTHDVNYEKLETPTCTIYLGDYGDEYVLHITAVPNAEKYTAKVILYNGLDEVLNFNPKVLTDDNLDLEITAGEEADKIYVEVVASDDDEIYADSDICVIERDLK